MPRESSITQEMTRFLKQAGLPISIQELFNTVLVYHGTPNKDGDDEEVEYGFAIVKDFEFKTQDGVLQIILWCCDPDEMASGVEPDEDGERTYTEFVYNYEFDDEGTWYCEEENWDVLLEVTRLFDPAKRKRARPEPAS